MASNTPPGNEGYSEPPEGGNGNGSSSLGPTAPAVASQPGRILIVLLVVVVGLGFIIYSLFSGPSKAPAPPKTEKMGVTPATQQPIELPPPPIEAPSLPTPSTQTTPTNNTANATPEPPVLPPPIEPPSSVTAGAPTNAARQARIKSGMLVLNGSSTTSSNSSGSTTPPAANSNPNLAFGDSVTRATTAEQVTAGQMSNLSYTIAQGKIIEGVLETAINSELPGQLRAIVSRDIFAESGHNVLIPKGSRLIGTYNASILRGQTRVYIIWTRVIRPDGIDIMVGSPGIDALGRAGMDGYVDNKYLETYSNALLGTIIDIGAASAGQKLVGGNVTQTTNTDGSSSSTGKAGAIALQQGVTNLSDVTKNIATGIMDERPTITVDQGTRVNVFVNKDLIFPPELIERGKFIP